MSSMKDVAIQKAKDIRLEYKADDHSLEETFQNIFKDKNISVRYDEQGELTEYNPDDGSWEITLPHGTPSARDNFTIAHELGHIFLEHTLDNNKIARSGLSTLTEIAANAFAAEFLMPEEKFRLEAQKCNFNERTLAEKFGVSQTAALIRMTALGLIS